MATVVTSAVPTTATLTASRPSIAQLSAAVRRYVPTSRAQQVTVKRSGRVMTLTIPQPTGMVNVGGHTFPTWGGNVMPPGVQSSDLVMTQAGDITPTEYFGVDLPEQEAVVSAGGKDTSIPIPYLLGGVAVVGLVLGFMLKR